MNSCQNFPSCIWTAEDLGIFIGKYLGPAITASVPDAEIWYGTYERPYVEKIDAIMQDPVVSQYITGVSFQWVGKQNSMITVNSNTKEVVYNPEFYLPKHFSYFIQPGARKLMTSGEDDGLFAFINPDKSIILIVGNAEEEIVKTSISIDSKVLDVEIDPHPFNTFVIN
jgi:O-glycosyl hydrolase